MGGGVKANEGSALTIEKREKVCDREIVERGEGLRRSKRKRESRFCARERERGAWLGWGL